MAPKTIHEKLSILADAAKYDASCASSGGERRHSRDGSGLGSSGGSGICHSYTPDGRCVSLLKILMTNFCIYDCSYCVNRVSSQVERARFSVEEVVHLTVEFYRRNYIEGLFLSSGIIRSPDDTMADMIRIVRSLREQENFRGYIHLKTIPDAAPELLDDAGKWADRLSINVELPTQTGLDKLAPEKNLDDIRKTMAKVRVEREAGREKSFRGKRRAKFAPAGQSTQMIVGADGQMMQRSCARARTCMPIMRSAASITRPFHRSPIRPACCRWHRRPCCASTGCIKPIGYCGFTGSTRASWAITVCWISIWIQSWPGRSPIAISFRWTSTARRANNCCAYPVLARARCSASCRHAAMALFAMKTCWQSGPI